MVRPIMTHRDIPKHKIRRIMHSRMHRRVRGDNHLRRKAPKSNIALMLQKKNKFTFVKLQNGRVLRAGASKEADSWLDKLGIKTREKVINCFNHIYIIDGFSAERRICFEYLGSHAHGSHKRYPTNRDKKLWIGKSPNELYKATIERFNFLTQLGFKIFFVWDLDYKKGFMGRYYQGQGDTLY